MICIIIRLLNLTFVGHGDAIEVIGGASYQRERRIISLSISEVKSTAFKFSTTIIVDRNDFI